MALTHAPPDKAHGPAEGLVSTAIEHLGAGDLSFALGLLDKALELEPDHVAALYYRAHAVLARGQRSAAIADARRGLASRTGARVGDLDHAGPECRARLLLVLGQAAEWLGDERTADEAFDEVERLAEQAERVGEFVLLQPRAVARALRWDLAGALRDLEVGTSGLASPDLVALLIRQQGRLSDARVYLNRTLEQHDAASIEPAWLLARWQLRAIMGDRCSREDVQRARRLLRAGPHPPGAGALDEGVAAALEGDRTAAREAFATAANLDPVSAWHWSASLGLAGAEPPPETDDPWQQVVTRTVQGLTRGEDLLHVAASVAGARARVRCSHESHALLALLAFREGDADRELSHLRAASEFGDLGSVLDVWIHARARQLGVTLRHQAPPGPGAERRGPRSDAATVSPGA